MHKIRIIANWKSNKSMEQAETWVTAVTSALQSKKVSDQLEVVIAPPFISLVVVAPLLSQSSNCSLATQDISQFPAGSYTGAVSVANLAALPIKYAIVGHSERRRYFHETHADVAGKVAQAVDAGITPVVCVDAEYVRSQAAAIAPDYLARCVVAYEPLAAIGTGNTAAVSDVKKVVADCKQTFGDVPVLYGGSVTADTIAEYLLVTDGALVGGASLDAEEFIELLTRIQS